MRYLCVFLGKKKQNMRLLNHSGADYVWSIFIYILFVMALLFSAYIYWWHTQTYVSYLVQRQENDEENVEV